MFPEIMLLLGLINAAMLCSCYIKELKWVPLSENQLYSNISITLKKNCESATLHVTTDNHIGEVTAGQMTVEGEYNGMPFKYNDPHACKPLAEKENGDDVESEFLKQAIQAVCRQSHMKHFEIGIPLNEEDMSLMQAFFGRDFKYKFCLNNINDIDGENACFEVLGAVVCDEDE